MAVPISIVVSGRSEPHGKYMASRKDLRADLWSHIPLYKLLKDPVKDEQVKWHQDCTHDLTVTCLHSQEAFPTVCQYIADLVEKEEVEQCLLGVHQWLSPRLNHWRHCRRDVERSRRRMWQQDVQCADLLAPRVYQDEVHGKPSRSSHCVGHTDRVQVLDDRRA